MKNEVEIQIRKLDLSDFPVLVEYRLKYLAELQGENTSDNNPELKTELIAYFEKMFRQQRFFAFQAEVQNRVVSFGAMIIKEIPGDFIKSTYLEGDILNMYTLPEFRGKGISSKLLKKLIEEAFKQGISKIALHTTSAGENVYRKSGFSEPGYPYLELILNPENFKH